MAEEAWQMSLAEDFDCQLSALERRVQAKREYWGLKLWTPIFRRILDRLRARDKELYQECMQIEILLKELEAPEASARVYDRLAKIKGLLAVVCLGFVLHGVLIDHAEFRRTGSVRVVRTVRGRRREEEAC